METQVDKVSLGSQREKVKLGFVVRECCFVMVV